MSESAEQADRKPEHVEGEKYRKSEPSENPVAGALNVTVSVPETIEIRMVNATVLTDYEVWFFISSVLSSAVVGFLIAFLQQHQGSWLAMTIVLFVLLIVSCAMTFVKRHKLRQKSKVIPMQATRTEEGSRK